MGTHWLSSRMEIVRRDHHKPLVGLAAYIDGVPENRPYHDERSGLPFVGDVKDAGRVVYTATLLPEGVPERYRDPEFLFNASEMHEDAWASKRYGEGSERWLEHCGERARCGLFGHATFSPDLSTPEVIAAALSAAEELFLKRGLPVRIAIHEDQANKHVHFLSTARTLHPDGEGARFGFFTPITNTLVELTRWQRHVREALARTQNRMLALGGRDSWVEWRKFAHLGSPFRPGVHEGAGATAQAERGEAAPVAGESGDRRRKNRGVADENRALALSDPLAVARHLDCTTPRFSDDDILREARRFAGADAAADVVAALRAHPEIAQVSGARLALHSRLDLEAATIAAARRLSARPADAVGAPAEAGPVLAGAGLAVVLGDDTPDRRRVLQDAVDAWTGGGKIDGRRVIPLSFSGDAGAAALGVSGPRVRFDDTLVGDGVHRLRWRQEEAARLREAMLRGELPDGKIRSAQQFIGRAAARRLRRGDLVIVGDLEAASPTDLAWLLTDVERASAAIVLSADARRLDAPERGALARAVSAEGHVVRISPEQRLAADVPALTPVVSRAGDLSDAVDAAMNAGLTGAPVIAADQALADAANEDIRRRLGVGGEAVVREGGVVALAVGEPIVFVRDAGGFGGAPRVNAGDFGVVDRVSGGEIEVRIGDWVQTFRPEAFGGWRHGYAVPARLAGCVSRSAALAYDDPARNGEIEALTARRPDAVASLHVSLGAPSIARDAGRAAGVVPVDAAVADYLRLRDDVERATERQAAARRLDWRDRAVRDACRRNGVRRDELDLHAGRARAMPTAAEMAAAERVIDYERIRAATREQWRLLMSRSTPATVKADPGYPVFVAVQRERDRRAAEIAAASALHRGAARLMAAGGVGWKRTGGDLEDLVAAGSAFDLREVGRHAAEHRRRESRESEISALQRRYRDIDAPDMASAAAAAATWADDVRRLPVNAVDVDLERRADELLAEHEAVIFDLAEAGVLDAATVFAWRNRLDARADAAALMSGADREAAMRLLALDAAGQPARRLVDDEARRRGDALTWADVKRAAGRSDQRMPTTEVLASLNGRIDAMLRRPPSIDPSLGEVAEAEAEAALLLARAARSRRHAANIDAAGLTGAVAWLASGAARVGFGFGDDAPALSERQRAVAAAAIALDCNRRSRLEPLAPLADRIIARGRISTGEALRLAEGRSRDQGDNTPSHGRGL